MAPTKPFVQPGDALQDFLRRFWQRQVNSAERDTMDWKHPPLPIARIKKVMKSDPDVKVMIAQDAPLVFCKACEIFISEITSRAFLIADSNKRRTLSRADIGKALLKSDIFDFLIDIVPREELQPGAAGPSAVGGSGGGGRGGGAIEYPENPSHLYENVPRGLPPASGTGEDGFGHEQTQQGEDQEVEVEAGVMLQRVLG